MQYLAWYTLYGLLSQADLKTIYQCLHTTVIGPDGEPVEIQIRTTEMHNIAEYGIAAHWKYKEGNTNVGKANIEEKLQWLRQMMEWEKDLKDPHEFLDAL